MGKGSLFPLTGIRKGVAFSPDCPNKSYLFHNDYSKGSNFKFVHKQDGKLPRSTEYEIYIIELFIFFNTLVPTPMT